MLRFKETSSALKKMNIPNPSEKKETREIAYGVDLDYVLDFIEFCNRGKASMQCWPSMAERWISKWGTRVSVDDLVQAAYKFVQEQDKSRNIRPISP